MRLSLEDEDFLKDYALPELVATLEDDIEGLKQHDGEKETIKELRVKISRCEDIIDTLNEA